MGMRKALAITALLLILAAPTVAQWKTGSVSGTVSDSSGVPLPGVAVTLTGDGAPQTTVTDKLGSFRFPGLWPGSYALRASLAGFDSVERSLMIKPGEETEITTVLPQQFVCDLPMVTPGLDTHKTSPGYTFSAQSLLSIPVRRDPWSVLPWVPGVLIGHASVIGPGSGGDQTVWSVDSVVITDMAALGSSPGSFDLDAVEEMQVTAGGSDASIATGGVVINMVVRRGSNDPRGSSRYEAAHNRVDRATDWGFELGGPIVRDHLWLWGSYDRPKIDRTTLETENAKVNGQTTPDNSFTAFVWNSRKTEHGRDAGPSRPPETTWDQSNFGASPTTWKIEDTQIVGSKFYLTGLYSAVNGGFELVPEGGDKVPDLDAGGVWHNSFFLAQSERPQKQERLDAANFFQTGTLSHELKYGAGYRVAEPSSLVRTPGGGWENNGLLLLARDGRAAVEARYSQLYAQDMISVGKLIANLGLRYDRQGGTIDDIDVRANPIFPNLLPAAHFAGRAAGFTWSAVVPRLGLTWSLGEQDDTLLRAGYSRFADQLGAAQVGWLNPLGAQQYRYFATSNHGGPALESADLGSEAKPPSGTVNPLTHGALESNVVDPRLKAPVTDEALFGFEHLLRSELIVGLYATWRRYSGILEPELLVFDGDAYAPENLNSTGRVHRRDDYVLADPVHGVLPNGQPYTISYYELRDGVTTRNGFLLKNGDREQDFRGLSLTLDKRLVNRWMMHGYVSWQDWTWRVPVSENQARNGSQVLQGDGNLFINSKWSYDLNGMYQVAPDRPWGFNLAANLQGRQGYPIPYGQRIVRSTIADTPGLGIVVPVTSDTDRFRYADVRTLDLRIEKNFDVSEIGLTVSADVFNAFNESTVLQRQSVLGGSNGNAIQERLSPRVFRLGVRLSFR